MTAPFTHRSESESAALPSSDKAPQIGIEQALGDLLPGIESALEQACPIRSGCPQRLGEAIRYAVLAPGKRLRPALVLMAAEACGGELLAAMPGAVAVEMIHAYSLIHDDLPAMDDDDLRRGRPTVHIKFDQATAILAGDALQPMAFQHLCDRVSDPRQAAEAVRVLATAAGPCHLVGGQADDLASESGHLPEQVNQASKLLEFDSDKTGSEGEPSSSQDRKASRQVALQFLEAIHRRKTGALFAASLDLGAILSGADPTQRAALAAYAADIGLAFQVVDDLLDHTADESKLGKRVGKDAERGKLTYPGLLGLSGARDLALELIESAKRHVEVLGPAGWRLTTLADYIHSRSH